MANPKHYVRPTTLTEALNALASGEAYPLSGGALALGTLDFPHETVVDLQTIPELNTVDTTDQGVVIGSAVKLQTIVDTPQIPATYKRALTRTLPLNIRNNTSVLESLTVDRIPMEWLAVLAAGDVHIKQMTPDSATHELSLTESEIITGAGHGQSLLDGLLLAIVIPNLANNEAIGSAFIARTPAGDPILNAAVRIQRSANNSVSHATAALCGVCEHHPVELMSLDDIYNKPLTDDSIAAQAAHIPHVLNPPDNYLGSAEYRKAMAAQLIRRSLEDAAAQLNA